MEQIAIKGIIHASLRKPVNFILYGLVGLQYIVLLKIMYDARQHLSYYWDWLLAILYFGPLVIGFAFRQFIKLLVRRDSMSNDAAMVCNDWLTVLLIMVYAILLEFRHLH